MGQKVDEILRKWKRDRERNTRDTFLKIKSFIYKMMNVYTLHAEKKICLRKNEARGKLIGAFFL